MPLLLILLALVWFVGTCWRIYRLARFYQIEEYMAVRFLRWSAARRERWLPVRPVSAALIGVALAFIFAESPGSILPVLVALIAAGVAVWPAGEGEIKKAFRPTARAKRLLAAAGFSAALFMLLALVLTHAQSTALVALIGLVGFLAAPLWLIVGNLLMLPVEAFFRWRFIQRAEQILRESRLTVIGITGSYGKTSTKVILTHILNGRYKAYPTPKSYNTLMGVCLAINNDLGDDRSADYFICEMGAYIPGEIARICQLTQPSIGIEIEIGPQHLERFGTLERTAEAKYELIKALPENGVGIFNWDNPHVRAMLTKGHPQTRLAVSRTLDPAHLPADAPRFIASAISESLDGLRFTVLDRESGTQEGFETPLLGLHNVTNILLATAVAIHEGMSLKEIARRVRTLQPAESRLVRQVTAQGITVINDAYSANPIGAISSLNVLGLHTGGRRLLITPGMVELGAVQAAENRQLGATAASQASDVILVGAEQTAPIKDGLLSAGFPAERLQTVNTLGEAVAWYQANLKAGDTVLFLNDLPDTYSEPKR